MQTIQFAKTMKATNYETVNAVDYQGICKYSGAYEYIPDDVPVKLYLDIDIKLNIEKPDDINMCLNDCKGIQNDVIDVLKGYCGELYNEEQIYWGSSHGLISPDKFKISYRVIFNNLVATKAQQKYLVKQLNIQAFETLCKTDIETYYPNGMFDKNPYNDKNQIIRSPYTSKPNENRPMKIENGTFEMSCITAFIPEDAICCNITVPEKMPTVRGEAPGATEGCPINTSIIENGMHLLKKYAGQGQYEHWTKIIWAIKNATNNKELARTFSKLDMKAYDVISFEDLWDNAEIRDDGVGIGTIMSYMMKVDETQTKQILKSFEKENIREQGLKLLQNAIMQPVENKKSIPIIEYNITKQEVSDPYSASIILSKTLKNTLKLCKENWYMLTENNLWKQQKEPTYYILKEFHKYLDFGREELNKKISNCEGEQKKSLIEQLEEWLKLYTYITKSGYLSVLTKNIKTLVCDDDFEDKLDNNPWKLAFKNGILDIKTKTLRPGGILSEDFITKTIPYDYNPVDTTYIKSILKKILNNNDEHLEYYLSVIGFSFIGQPDLEKSIYFMIDKTKGGKGDNGKTFFFDILSHIFPNYVYCSNSSLLDIKNTKVHKQLVKTKGIRLLWLEELPREKNTNAVLMKQIGDGTTIENEIVFGTTELINVMFKMFTLSNHIPKIDPNEEAVYNRYKQISFNSKFDRTGQLTEDKPEQLLFKADTTLSNTIKTMHYNDVISLIVEYAHKYHIRKLPNIPQQFLQDVSEVKAKNDEFGMWFDENCEIVDGGRVAIKLLVKECGMSEKMVKEGMERKGFTYNKELKGIGKDTFGKYYKGGYIGVKYVEPTDEEEPIIQINNEDDTDNEEQSDN